MTKKEKARDRNIRLLREQYGSKDQTNKEFLEMIYNKTQSAEIAAGMLGITGVTFINYLKHHGITRNNRGGDHYHKEEVCS